MRAIVGVACAGVFVAGCATVPDLQYEGIEISQIVHRVQCELAFAVPEIDGKYPSGNFQWVKYWTAKVDLQLDTNDLSSLKPGATFIEPFAPSGGVAQSFTLGAGGELTANASRTDKLSFTLSLKELMAQRNSARCVDERRAGLLGHLGLREWIASALTPVGNRQLTIGFHEPPTGKPSKIPGLSAMKAAEKAREPPPTPLSLFNDALADMRKAERFVEDARKASDSAYDFALGVKVQQTYNAGRKALSKAADATDSYEDAMQLLWKALRLDRDVGLRIEDATKRAAATKKIADDTAGKGAEQIARERDDAARAAQDEAREKAIPRLPQGEPQKFEGDAKRTNDQITKVKQQANAAWELLPRDPPLDSITHSVKFTVTTGVNATPNWTLVRFRGPGQNSPFAMASRQRINQLDVVLGAPAEPGGKALSDEQKRQLDNLQLEALRARLIPQ